MTITVHDMGELCEILGDDADHASPLLGLSISGLWRKQSCVHVAAFPSFCLDAMREKLARA